MIQDINPHKFDLTYGQPKAKDEDFVLRDIGSFNKMMSDEIEPGFSTDLFRFPGGSSSYKARIKAKVRDAGYAWFDWNMMTGDAQYSFSSDREMLEYTLGQAHGKDVVILLMHEGKTRTRRILPELVAYFRENGYEFVNIASNLIDEGGFLPKEYCSDNYVHQTYSAYAVWADVLRSLAARHITGQGRLVFE